jgi:hypothetical protein
MTTTLHLMTQRGQPYGSVRKCCEMCGAMLVTRSDAYWRKNAYTDNPADWRRWPADTANVPDELVPCTVQARHEPPNVFWTTS